MLCSSLASVFKVSCVQKACLGIHFHPSTGLPRSSVKHTHESGRRPVVRKGAHGFFRCFFLSGPRSPSSASPTPSSPYRSSNAAVSAWPSRFTISVKYACVALCTVACVVAGQRARGDRRALTRTECGSAWHGAYTALLGAGLRAPATAAREALQRSARQTGGAVGETAQEKDHLQWSRACQRGPACCRGLVLSRCTLS